MNAAIITLKYVVKRGIFASATKCSLTHLKSTNRIIDSVDKTAMHYTAEKTVKNCTKFQKNIIKVIKDEIRPEIIQTVKVRSIIENTATKLDLIDMKEQNP